MIINEPEEERLKRLEAYETCKQRGHEADCGIGPYLICKYCGTHYRFVLEERPDSVPTNKNVSAGGNMFQTVPA